MSRSPTPHFGQPRADRTPLRASVIPSIVVLLLLVLAPQRAAACYGCYGATAARPVFGASIPADGVLAFAFEGEHPSGAAVALRRLGGDGAELELTLETLAPHLVGAPLLIARPLAPLEVGATYEVVLSAVNDSATMDESDCELAPHLEVVTTVRADPAGHVAPTPPELDVVFTVDVVTTTPPDAQVVCCDRDDQPDVGSDCGWGRSLGDRCTSTVGLGVLRAAINVEAAAWDPRGQIYIEGFAAAATTALRDSTDPFCVTPAARDLITGARALGPAICPDPELTSAVGEHPHDPAQALVCRPLWTCTDPEGGWDPAACRRWRAEGCTCDAGDGAPPLFALLTLMLFLSRLRHRRAQQAAIPG